MSVLTKTVPIVTAADGSDLTTVRAGGLILRAISLELGTLSTPDITITEQDSGKVILDVAAVAADTTWYPAVEGNDNTGAAISGSALPVPLFGRLEIATAGGGDTKSGTITLLYER